jgi:hypothetical protein
VGAVSCFPGTRRFRFSSNVWTTNTVLDGMAALCSAGP